MKTKKLLEIIKQLNNGYHLEKNDVIETISELKLIIDRLELRLKVDYKQ